MPPFHMKYSGEVAFPPVVIHVKHERPLQVKTGVQENKIKIIYMWIIKK